jgi:CheY-like chemotaxis protein
VLVVDDNADAANALGATLRGRGALLVALTAWGSADDKRRAAAAGFDHHLTKPAALEDIEALFTPEEEPRQRAAGQGH